MTLTREEFEDVIEHFGVKGMKWGVRNNASSGSNGPKKDNSARNKKIAGAVLIGTGVVIAGVILKRNSNIKLSQMKSLSKSSSDFKKIDAGFQATIKKFDSARVNSVRKNEAVRLNQVRKNEGARLNQVRKNEAARLNQMRKAENARIIQNHFERLLKQDRNFATMTPAKLMAEHERSKGLFDNMMTIKERDLGYIYRGER